VCLSAVFDRDFLCLSWVLSGAGRDMPTIPPIRYILYMAKVSSRLFLDFACFGGCSSRMPLFAFLQPYFLWLNADLRVVVKTVTKHSPVSTSHAVK